MEKQELDSLSSKSEYKKIIAIMQPTYFPWLGYFDLIDQSDIFVFLDNVQLVKRSWGVRNRIKTAHGELYITIPIRKVKSREESRINDAIILNTNWKSKHLKSIQFAYNKSKHFDEVYSLVAHLINQDYSNLGDYTINIINELVAQIGLQTTILRSSNLGAVKGKKDLLLVNICKSLKANVYLSARGSFEYIERFSPGGEFSKNNIELYYHNYIHPIYPQLHKDFLPYMSILDLLFNIGFKKTMDVIRSGRKQAMKSADLPKALKIEMN